MSLEHNQLRPDTSGVESSGRPLRVLHLICGLGGGGSERWLRDVVRLSPPGFVHRVGTIYPTGAIESKYAAELEDLGVYEPRRSVVAATEQSQRWLRAVWARRPHRLANVARATACIGSLPGAVRMARTFRPDVIHSHTQIDFVPCLSLARMMKIPLVHTVPNLFSQMHADGYGWVPRVYARTHPWVACFSTGEAHGELRALGIPADRIRYDLGGVDLDRVNAVRAERGVHAREIRRRLQLPATCRIALSVGRLHHSKGHPAGLRAVKALKERVPDIQFVVLGEGEQKRQLERMAEQLEIRDRVHLVGFQQDPLPYYAASDVYLRTARYEAENLAFYAAMAMGLPIVGFDTKDGRDLLCTVGGGVQVPQDDAKQLADAAAAMLQLEDRGRSLGRAGRIYAEDHLDLRQNVKGLTSVYQRLARGGQGSGATRRSEQGSGENAGRGGAIKLSEKGSLYGS